MGYSCCFGGSTPQSVTENTCRRHRPWTTLCEPSNNPLLDIYLLLCVPPAYSQPARIPLGNAGRTINSSPPHVGSILHKPSNSFKKGAQTAIPRPLTSQAPKSYGTDLGIGHAPYGPKGGRNGSVSTVCQPDLHSSRSSLRSSRNRRESFKPRPSTDSGWSTTEGGIPGATGGHWMTANVVREEDEY